MDSTYPSTCLPTAIQSYTIYPLWIDQDTTSGLSNCPSGGCGIFTSVSGTAPNRILNIEYRTVYWPNLGPAQYEVRLYESSGQVNSHFDIIYQTTNGSTSGTTVGVQRAGTGDLYTQYLCATGTLPSGLLIQFTQPPCGTPLPTNTSTPTHTPVPTNTQTATNTPA